MTRREAIWRLEEIVEEIYDKLNEVRAILKEVAPEELERAEVYWMAHVDGALLNRKGWLGGSFVSLQDTLEALEEEEEEEW
jgi:hypothetical protein